VKNAIVAPYRSYLPLKGTRALAGLGCPPKNFKGFGDTGGANSPYLPRYSYGNVSPQMASATTTLAQPVTVVTPSGAPAVTTLAQAAAAGMTLHPSMKGLGRLGLSQDVQASAKGASEGAAISGAVGAAISTAVAAGIIGQTALPIPGVGFVIGAIVGEALQLLKAREGKAAISWDYLVSTWPGAKQQQPQVPANEGRGLQEVSFAESLKGMQDENNSAFPGCGANGHKNPDCMMLPMGQAIINGYANGTVPLDATTQEVFQLVVIPWLASGGGGSVNWGVLKAQPTQLTMLQAATDRYLAGLPITRADMVEPQYKNDPGYNAFHLLSLVDGLIAKGVLQAAPPVTAAAPPAPNAPANAQPITSVNPGTPPKSAPQIIPNPLAPVQPNPVARTDVYYPPQPSAQPVAAEPSQPVQIELQQPAQQIISAPSAGMSSTTLLIVGGIAAAVFLGTRK
jgi:hypothetical protein